jgi:hypothetical protein
VLVPNSDTGDLGHNPFGKDTLDSKWHLHTNNNQE